MPALQQERSALETIYRRRAVRAYLPDPVPPTAIRELLEAAVQAPTAMHLEPWAFVVIQDRERLARYSEQAKAILRQDPARHQPLLHAPGLATSDTHLAGMLADPAFNIFYDAGTLIVICGKPMGPFVTADCWLAAENLMLAACAQDLGTCCIGLAIPLLNRPGIKADLHIPADVSVVAPIIVGVPAGVTPRVSRKEPEILCWLS